MIQQRDEHCNCRHRKTSTPLLYKPQRLGRVEAVIHNNGHAGQRGHGKVSDQAGDVEERGYADDDIIAVKLHPLLIEGRIKNNITMRVHCPFCSASCARSSSISSVSSNRCLLEDPSSAGTDSLATKSSSLVVMTNSTFVFPMMSRAIVSYNDSRQRRPFAPESLRWYSSSRCLNIGLHGTTIAPTFQAP